MANECLWIRSDGRTPFEGRFAAPGRRGRPAVYADDGTLIADPRTDDGRPVREKLPGYGYVGTDIHAMRPMPEAQALFSDFLRADGHTVTIRLTNAAAHVPTSDTSTERNARLKARHFGWIEYGKCPCLMVVSGEIRKEQLQAKVNTGQINHKTTKDGKFEDPVTGRPCNVSDIGRGKPPCPHYLAERKARREQRALETQLHEVAYKTDAEKLTAAIVEATKANGAQLAAALEVIRANNAKASAAP